MGDNWRELPLENRPRLVVTLVDPLNLTGLDGHEWADLLEPNDLKSYVRMVRLSYRLAHAFHKTVTRDPRLPVF